MKNFLPLIIGVLLFSGCMDRGLKTKFEIVGKIQNYTDSIFLKELTSKGLVSVDSILPNKKGEFNFKVKMKEASFYVLDFKNSHQITLLAEIDEKIELNINAKDFRDYSVNGSEGSEMIRILNKELFRNYHMVDSLKHVFDTSQQKTDFYRIKQGLDSIYYSIFQKQKDFNRAFIKSHLNSLASLIALYQNFGRQPILNKTDDIDYYLMLDSSLTKVNSKSKHIIDFHEKVMEIRKTLAEEKLSEKRTAPGNPAPEFSLPDVSNNLIKLSSLKGKYVLLNFWSTTCIPCRKEFSLLSDIYSKNKKNDLVILSVSIEKNKSLWLNAVKANKMNWLNVIDMFYWKSAVLKLYNIKDLPYIVLIDKNGNIKAKASSVKEIEPEIKKLLSGKKKEHS